MKSLLDVYKDITKSNIGVYDIGISRKSLIMKKDEEYNIAINKHKILNSIDEKCVLAEEYSHYKTGSLYGLAEKLETIARCENKASKYRTRYLIPKQELINAIYEGNYYYYELADYFNVDEDLIKKAIDQYGLEYEIQIDSAVI